MPQVLPVLHAADELLDDKEKELPPLILEAKVDTFLRTCRLLQLGHNIPSTSLALRTSSSKFFPQSAHTNSKIGMHISLIPGYHNFRCCIWKKVTGLVEIRYNLKLE
jgi:hypothetical protein